MRSSLATNGSHINSRHRLSRAASALVATAVASSVLLPPAQAVARASAKTLACRASVSDARPSDYSTTTVYVKTVAKARVTTSAHYRTTTNTQSAEANSHGRAAINYDVSDATEGFKVIVTVRVQSGSRSGRCQTSYVPG